MAEVLKSYPWTKDDKTVQGDNISVNVHEDGMHLTVNRLPFLETTKGDMPCLKTGEPIMTTREVAHIVPPGGSLTIALSIDGVVTISQG